MSSPIYLAMNGTFVVAGYAPDGDSIRFVPDTPRMLDALPRNHLLRLGREGSVQVRLEGIDAPELHFLNGSQPLGRESRDALVEAFGFRGLRYTDVFVERGTRVDARGAVLTRSIDPHGRLIAYAFAGTRTQMGRAETNAHAIAETINVRLLREGMVYPIAYDTQPAAHRASMALAACTARERGAGVWARDASHGFTLRGARSIGPIGKLILPKLFRRCTEYLQELAIERGAVMFPTWLTRRGGAQNDVVRVAGGRLTRLAALVRHQGPRVQLKADPLDLRCAMRAA